MHPKLVIQSTSTIRRRSFASICWNMPSEIECEPMRTRLPEAPRCALLWCGLLLRSRGLPSALNHGRGYRGMADSRAYVLETGERSPFLQSSVFVRCSAEVVITQTPSALYTCDGHDSSFHREHCYPPSLRLC